MSAGAPAGASIPVAQPVMVRASAVGRVTKHRSVLGILWIVKGLLALPGGFVLMGLSGAGAWPFGYHNGWGDWTGGMPHFMFPFFGALGSLVLVSALLSFAVGIGLLAMQSWARLLAIVIGVIELINVPLGTALGIYTLWVMMPDESDREWAALARARMPA